MKEISFAEDFTYGAAKATHTFALTSSSFQNATGKTSVTITAPSLKCKYNTSAGGRNAQEAWVDVRPSISGVSAYAQFIRDKFIKLAANTYGAMTRNSGSSSWSVPLSTLFSSSNSTSKSVSINWYIKKSSGDLATWKTSGSSSEMVGSRKATFSGTISGEGTVTLNAPPTFTASNVILSRNPAYVGKTTATVTLSSLSAKYGGTIKSAVLKIGSQTATRTTNGNFVINLNAAGTFTPTVTVTDSRGQVTTKSLAKITVNAYTNPSLSFSVSRTNETGIGGDEEKNAVANVKFTYMGGSVKLVEPTIAVTDNNGVSVATTVKWYKSRAADGTLSDPLTSWDEIATESTVYALFADSDGDITTGPFDSELAYKISITPNDSLGVTGKSITQTLGSAYYTIDFLAGGHGVAFGQAATQEGFVCNMPAYFKFTNEFYGENIFHTHLDLDTGIMLRLLDASDYKYPLAYDNLWDLYIGSNPVENRHHSGPRGYTLISTGYNTSASKGNDTIHVMVPNATNSGQTTFGVLHEGYAPKTPTISISASTGVLDAYNVVQWGKMVQLWLRVRNTASVAKGGNLFVGTINTANLRPVANISTAAYYNEYAFPAVLNKEGNITCRNANSTAFSTIPASGAGVNLGFTYIIP